jgi:hypothetical protein
MGTNPELIHSHQREPIAALLYTELPDRCRPSMAQAFSLDFASDSS